MAMILGIETTCDETAAAVVRDGVIVPSSVVSSQIALHQKFGGVVPEVAARAHLEALDAIVAAALREAGVEPRELDAVAVAHAPGLIGCLLVGVSAAKGYAFGWGKPLIGVNHVQAHLQAVMLRGAEEAERGAALFPAIGLVISGGHSSMYHAAAFDRLTRIGSTHDDAVGEAFDKVAAILQLGYPGGPLIDRLAERGDPRAIDFPQAMIDKESLDFSFSGLKTSVLYHVNGRQGRERDASALSEQQKADVAASFQRAAAEILVKKVERACGRFAAKSILIGGGVSANRAIRAGFAALGARRGVPVLMPAVRFCTDNGAMIAGLADQHFAAGAFADLGLDAVATV
jgi:N6-L-threonylcarbamoyladenine synthase